MVDDDEGGKWSIPLLKDELRLDPTLFYSDKLDFFMPQHFN